MFIIPWKLLKAEKLSTNMSTSYVSYTKPIFEVIKIPKILEKSSFFACVESKCVSELPEMILTQSL